MLAQTRTGARVSGGGKIEEPARHPCGFMATDSSTTTGSVDLDRGHMPSRARVREARSWRQISAPATVAAPGLLNWGELPQEGALFRLDDQRAVALLGVDLGGGPLNGPHTGGNPDLHATFS
jgi:hypothetical protein